MNLRSVAIWVLLLCGLMSLAPAAAQTPSEPGLDIIFIVDQSGSMTKGAIRENYCAPECRLPPSDPTGLALSSLPGGVDPLFGRLLIRELGRSDKALQSETNRMGVILFGDTAVTALPLTEISSVTNPSTNKQEANIASLLPRATRELGDTSFSSAFKEACAMLDCNKPMPATRRRVLVLLTDGAPVDDAIDRNLTGASYYRLLRERTPALFADEQTKLWVLGIDQNNLFWGSNRGFWEEFAPGRTMLLRDPVDASTAFRDIAADSIGEVGEPKSCDGSAIEIDPYLSSLYLVLTYSDTDTKAIFTMPSGVELTPDHPSVVSYAPTALTESFTVKNPEPGRWVCGKVGDNIDAQFKTIQGDFKGATVKGVTVNGSKETSTCELFEFTVQYTDSEGAPLVELPGFPLTQAAEIMIGDTTETRVMELNGASRSEWKTQAPLKPSSTGGTYPITFRVQYAGRDLFTADSAITIKPDLPCLEIESPANGASLPLHKNLTELPVLVRVKLTQGGVASTPQGVFNEDINRILTGTVQLSDGRTESFNLTSAAEPGIFAAQLDNLKSEGNYTVTVALNATTKAGQAYALLPEPRTFVRGEDPTYALIRTVTKVVVVLAAVIALALAGWLAFLVLPPYPKGTIVIEAKRDDGLGWTAIRSYPMGRQKLFGFLPTKRPKVAGKNVPRITGIEKVVFRRAVQRKDQGVEVVATGAKKKPVVAGTFLRDDQSKTFGAKYRVRYEK